MPHGTLSLLACISLLPGALSAPSHHPSPHCRFLPGDRQWPRNSDWAQLNTTVSGRLIAGKPLAHVCHGPDYDAAACAEVRNRWSEPPLYFPDPVNVMSPYWLNLTCSPFSDRDNAPCELGNLASYAINVTSAEDVVAGLAFAQNHNIRVQVKNTGHDYLGRSTGPGSLALWTHNLKDIAFINYTSPQYTGPAAKLGAGVQAFDAYKVAAEHGLRVVGGYCPTVGIAGGYLQGAGHGPLLGAYGLAADNVLEFEAVTVDGRHLTASPTSHADLFWALSGGGAGNYAVVLSVTTKAHRDGVVAGGSLTVDHLQNGDDEAFWEAVQAWHRRLLVFDTIPGLTTVYRITNASFQVTQATLVDHPASDLEDNLRPFLRELDALGLHYTYEVNDHPSYYGHFATYNPGLPYGSYLNNETIGGRLVSRETVRERLPELTAVLRNITSTQTGTGAPVNVNGVAGNATHLRTVTAPGRNAVLPAWREALYHLIIEEWFDGAGPVDVFQEAQAAVNEHQELLRAVDPEGGAYINEATFDNPAWKEDYFGENYGELLRIKKRYDPDFVLYGPSAVGSDAWTRTAEGRLCRRHLDL
ncbi:FAD-dependent oxidoreductase [Aspergillus lucknowensis]|uniref:FAD-binding PCMH-type domain-containing protein n=1 Tax=Aspergillus lucknowensis TaxID=176173 RepID=A0ABR4LHE3_9EURO